MNGYNKGMVIQIREQLIEIGKHLFEIREPLFEIMEFKIGETFLFRNS